MSLIDHAVFYWFDSTGICLSYFVKKNLKIYGILSRKRKVVNLSSTVEMKSPVLIQIYISIKINTLIIFYKLACIQEELGKKTDLRKKVWLLF